jgi:hypothetical protein
MNISERDGRWNRAALNVPKLPAPDTNARDTKGGATIEMVRTGDNRWHEASEVGQEFEPTPNRVVEPARPMDDAGVCLDLGAGTGGGASRHQVCSTAYLTARDLTAQILGKGASLDYEV